MATAAPNLIKCVPISSLLMPSRCSPIATTVSWSALMKFWDMTCVILLLIMIAEIGISTVVLGYPLIYCTIAAAAQMGQSFTLPKAICVTVSIFLSFFCFLKVNETQSENSNSASSWLISLPSQKNLMLQSWRIVVCCWSAAETLRYLQDLHAKNIARQVSWETAIESLEIVFFTISAMTHIEIAFWYLLDSRSQSLTVHGVRGIRRRVRA